MVSKSKMFYCFALPSRKCGDGGTEKSGTVQLGCCFLWIAAGIRMVLISEGRMDFVRVRTAAATQSVDGAPLRNHSEPGRERAVRIVGLPRSVNGDQRFLHYVINAIGSYSLPARHLLDEWNAVAQQRFVGGLIPPWAATIHVARRRSVSVVRPEVSASIVVVPVANCAERPNGSPRTAVRLEPYSE